MKIKWSNTAIKNLIFAIEYLEEMGYNEYAAKLESEILIAIEEFQAHIYYIKKIALNSIMMVHSNHLL